MSDTVCILPFISLDRNTDSTDIPPGPCCLYQHQSEPAEDFESYWQSDEIKSVRSKMLDGEKPKGCWKCFHDESLGKQSMRQSVNQSRLDDIQNLSADVGKPIQIKMLSGASCNLACRMCVSHVSSRVNTVWKSIGRPTQTPYAYDEMADNYIRSNADTIQYIDLMGGEPLYHKKIISLLQFLVDNNHADAITLFLTTNGMLIKDKIKDLLANFKKVVAIFSLDGVGPVHEYIRPDSDWNLITKNMQDLRQYENIDVLVQATISVLNILRLPELDEWCEKNDYHQTQKSTVHEPNELQPKQLPLEMRDKVADKYKSFLQEKTYPCLGFIKQLDEHWKTDISKVMPEWDLITKDQWEVDLGSYNRVKKYFYDKFVGHERN